MTNKDYKFKTIVALIVLCITLIASMNIANASVMVMIYKDGKLMLVDKDSEEAINHYRQVKINDIERAPNQVIAKPTSQKITVDGVPTNFRAYNIDGFNYFMLRDIAYVFNGTKVQFEVGWDQEKFAINLETGKPYTGAGVGFEMDTPHVEEKGIKSKASIYKDGEEALLLGYTIEGYTYFKLRDLGNELGFDVGYESASQTVVLRSDKDALLPQAEPEPEPKEEPEEKSEPLIIYRIY